MLVFFAIVAAIGAGVYYFVLKGEEKKPIEATPQSVVTGKLFPENADLIAYLDIAGILADPDVQDAYEQLAAQYPGVMPATLDDALTQLRVQAGGQVDPWDFASVAMFGEAARFDSDLPYIGFIVSGTFTMSDLSPLFQSIPDATVTSSDYKGLILYKIDPEEGPQIGVAFLGEGVLVAGTLDAAEDVIDIVVGDAPSLSSGPVYEAYNSLDDDPIGALVSVFKFAIELPPEDRADMGPPFDAADTVGLSIDKSGQTISVEVIAHFANAAAAQNAQTAIEGWIQQAVQFIQSDPNIPAEVITALSGLLNDVNMSTSDSWVTAELSLTITEIEGLINMLQSLEQFLPGGEEQARNVEYNNMQLAVAATMADNMLSSIPNPVTAVATNDMSAFPDTTSNSTNGGKILDSSLNLYIFPGDKTGYLLYSHDMTADGAQTGLVNYIFSTTTWYYTVDADGTVRQWSDPTKTIEYTP